MASTSYVLALLRILHRRPGRPVGSFEIYDALRLEERARTHGFVPEPAAFESALAELEDLGVFVRTNEGWSLARDVAAREVRAQADSDAVLNRPVERPDNEKGERDDRGGAGGAGGGGRDGDGAAAGGGDDDDGRGGGLGEVLAHPVLFSTGELGLTAALEAALRG